MMEEKQIIYYDWKDIQSEICKVMNLEEDKFRDYHKVIGGDYKDLWHEWMEYFDSDVKNGVITNSGLEGIESIESKIEWITENNKEWLEPFVRAVYEVLDKHNIKWIKYFW